MKIISIIMKINNINVMKRNDKWRKWNESENSSNQWNIDNENNESVKERKWKKERESVMKERRRKQWLNSVGMKMAAAGVSGKWRNQWHRHGGEKWKIISASSAYQHQVLVTIPWPIDTASSDYYCVVIWRSRRGYSDDRRMCGIDDRTIVTVFSGLRPVQYDIIWRLLIQAIPVIRHRFCLAVFWWSLLYSIADSLILPSRCRMTWATDDLTSMTAAIHLWRYLLFWWLFYNDTKYQCNDIK